jgi:cytochrome c
MKGFFTKVLHDRSTRRFYTIVLMAVLVAPTIAVAQKPLGIGRVATPDEIKRIDIDVRRRTRVARWQRHIRRGREDLRREVPVVSRRQRVGRIRRSPRRSRVGQELGFRHQPKLVKTVGNYWPYATTLYDYTNRAMPFMQPGTLTPDETYSLVAYILALNKIVPEDAVMNRTTLPKVVMPSRDRFVIDNRKGGKVVK